MDQSDANIIQSSQFAIGKDLLTIQANHSLPLNDDFRRRSLHTRHLPRLLSYASHRPLSFS